MIDHRNPIGKVLDALHAKGCKPKETAPTKPGIVQQFKAKCPAHDDTVESLSIGVATNDAVLVNCHRACEFKELVRALGLQETDFFRLPDTQKRRGSDLGRSLRKTAYRLFDADGNLVAEHHRQDYEHGKRIWWERNGKKNLGGLALEVLPLYGLDYLAKFEQGTRVFVVEGEKAYDALKEQNIPCVATVTGAGKIPSDEQIKVLLGYIPCLWPDNDPDNTKPSLRYAGQRHMDRIADRLTAMKGDPHLVQWDASPEKRDAFDFFGSSAGTMGRALVLLEEAVPYSSGIRAEPEREPDPDADDPNEDQIDCFLRKSGLGKLDAGFKTSQLTAPLAKLSSMLAGVDPILVQVVRVGAMEKLESMGVKGPAKLVDAALANRPRDSFGSALGQAIGTEKIEPWDQPVDGAELLEDLAAFYRRYLVLPPHAPETMALWALHTWAFDAFFVTPYLAFSSPVKQCGKTNALTCLGATSCNAELASNLSPAAIFRVIEMVRPSIIFDEVDRVFFRENTNEELIGILNAGFTTATAYVWRCVGDNHQPRKFSTWCPKAMAAIGRIPETLVDRAIHVQMRRKTPEDKVARFSLRRIPLETSDLRRKCARWAADNATTLAAAEPAPLEKLGDRDNDIWATLLVIADAAGGPWPERVRQAALALSREKDPDENKRIMLLQDLWPLVETRRSLEKRFVPTTDMIAHLTGLEDRPWATWRKSEKPITPVGLANLLRPFKISPDAHREHGEPQTFRGYALDDIEEAFARYVRPVAPLGCNESQGGNSRNDVGDQDLQPSEGVFRQDAHGRGRKGGVPSSTNIGGTRPPRTQLGEIPRFPNIRGRWLVAVEQEVTQCPDARRSSASAGPKAPARSSAAGTATARRCSTPAGGLTASRSSARRRANTPRVGSWPRPRSWSRAGRSCARRSPRRWGAPRSSPPI